MQALGLVDRERRAHDAGGVADDERHLLGRAHRGRHEQVAFVLPVVVVGDDDDLAGLEGGDDRFDEMVGIRRHSRLSPARRGCGRRGRVLSARRRICQRPRTGRFLGTAPARMRRGRWAAYSITPMPMALMSFAHCPVSLAITAANSAGGPPITSMPSTANCLRTSGSASTLMVSA